MSICTARELETMVLRAEDRIRALEQRVENLEVAREQERAQQTCRCGNGSPGDWEGPLRDCPVHGEQERAQTNDVVDGLLRDRSPDGRTSVAQLRADLAAARQAVEDSEAQRAQMLDERNEYHRNWSECSAELKAVKRERDERAVLSVMRAGTYCAYEECENPPAYCEDCYARETNDLAGELRALRMDHEALIEAHAKSCDERARLVAELERARENEPKIVRVMMSALDRVHDALGTDGERGEGDVADRVAAVVQELSRLRAGLRTMVERAAAEIPNKRARENFLADWEKELGDGE